MSDGPAGPRRIAAAEGFGTGFLAMAVVGSGIMAERLTGDVAVALLANTIATGAILVVLITALGPVSGAHLNPAVTLVMLLRREIGLRLAALMIAAQLAGAIIGVAVAHVMFGESTLAAGIADRSGPALWLAEIVAAFGLVATILLVRERRPDAVAWSVGLYITAAYWFTASTSFANPALAIARGLTPTFAGIRPADVPLFIVAECIGALLAGGAVALLRERPAAP